MEAAQNPSSSLFTKLANASFIRFAGVGLLSTILDILVYNLALRLHFGLYISGALGFFVGFSNGYFFNSRYVFKSWSAGRYTKYLVVSLIGLLLTELILHIGHVEIGLSYNAAKLVAVIIVFVWNYILSKYWAFK